MIQRLRELVEGLLGSLVSAAGPRTIIALVVAGPLLLGALIGYLLIAILYHDDLARIDVPPSLPSEWLEEEPPPPAGQQAPTFGKTL